MFFYSVYIETSKKMQNVDNAYKYFPKYLKCVFLISFQVMPFQVPQAHSLADTSAPLMLTEAPTLSLLIQPFEPLTQPACKWPSSGPPTLTKVRITVFLFAEELRNVWALRSLKQSGSAFVQGRLNVLSLTIRFAGRSLTSNKGPSQSLGDRQERVDGLMEKHTLYHTGPHRDFLVGFICEVNGNRLWNGSARMCSLAVLEQIKVQYCFW